MVYTIDDMIARIVLYRSHAQTFIGRGYTTKSMLKLQHLPPSFCLKNLATITSRGFELKVNPGSSKVDEAMRSWFKSFNVYNEKRQLDFLNKGQFDVFAALSFPDADVEHLETCLAFFFWAFSTDDYADKGGVESNPEEVQNIVDNAKKIIYGLDMTFPCDPYAAMLQDLMKRISSTATPGTKARFIHAFEKWSENFLRQSYNRSRDRMPSIAEFILMRRATIGAAMVEAMVEYSLDLDIPDYVFEDSIVKAMSEATTDIMTWPNDLCSFNKEQADGDFQNLVFCIMVERDVELQEAVDILTTMLDTRVTQYLQLKSSLPSFGAKVDAELARYIKALEYFVQATVVWYYKCHRYFRGLDIIGCSKATVLMYERSV